MKGSRRWLRSLETQGVVWCAWGCAMFVVGWAGGSLVTGDRALAADQGGQSSKFVQGAAGLSVGVLSRRDYGEGTATRLFFEPVFHSYFALPVNQLYARASFQFGYRWQQPEMPQAIRVEETDIYGALGGGLVWDWIVTTSLSGGPEFVRRTITLKTAAPIDVPKDAVSDTEMLLGWYAQTGFGISMLRGFLLFEPFFRYRWFGDDAREGWGYGLETTFQIF